MFNNLNIKQHTNNKMFCRRDPNSIKCDKCSGTGRKTVYAVIDCTSCGGTGDNYHPRDFTRPYCGSCRGSGEFVSQKKINCIDCKGTGRVLTQDNIG